MKRIIVFALALVTMVATYGQKKRVHAEGNRDHLMAEKLNLSNEQREKAKKLNEDFRKNMMELRKKDDITVKEWRSRMTELNEKHHQDLRGLLTKDQKDKIEKFKVEKRKLAEIDANARMEKMKFRLDLKDDQVLKLKKQQGEMMEKMRALHENKSMDMMKKREEMKMLMKERKENMKSILTEDQLKKMEESRNQIHRKKRMLS